MLKYLAKRIFRSLITLFIVITIVFSLLRLMPVEGYFDNCLKNSWNGNWRTAIRRSMV